MFPQICHIHHRDIIVYKKSNKVRETRDDVRRGSDRNTYLQSLTFRKETHRSLIITHLNNIILNRQNPPFHI